MYLCVDDIYATIRIFVLNFYKGSAKPDWVDNVVMKILEWQETYLQEQLLLFFVFYVLNNIKNKYNNISFQKTLARKYY